MALQVSTGGVLLLNGSGDLANECCCGGGGGQNCQTCTNTTFMTATLTVGVLVRWDGNPFGGGPGSCSGSPLYAACTFQGPMARMGDCFWQSFGMAATGCTTGFSGGIAVAGALGASPSSPGSASCNFTLGLNVSPGYACAHMPFGTRVGSPFGSWTLSPSCTACAFTNSAVSVTSVSIS